MNVEFYQFQGCVFIIVWVIVTIVYLNVVSSGNI